MCRSSSTIASRLEFQPATTWTLSDQESNQAAMSQEKIGSLLFKVIATQVINHGRDAALDLQTMEHELVRDNVISDYKQQLVILVHLVITSSTSYL
jgi:hypothetical protein